MRLVAYNRKAALNYARIWALKRNPLYYDFDGIGGDCTNFVSQCIYAGAGIMNSSKENGWYYRNLNQRSPSWTGVEFLLDFLVGNRSVGPFGHVVSIQDTVAGDVIQLMNGNDFYHSLLVVENQPMILVAAHSDDAWERPLTEYTFEDAIGIHIDGVRTW